MLDIVQIGNFLFYCLFLLFVFVCFLICYHSYSLNYCFFFLFNRNCDNAEIGDEEDEDFPKLTCKKCQTEFCFECSCEVFLSFFFFSFLFPFFFFFPFPIHFFPSSL